MTKKGYVKKTVDGRVYYFSNYSSFTTPHLNKMLVHVAKRQAALEALKVERAAKKKVVQSKSSSSKAKAPAGASSSTPTLAKEK